MSCLEQIYKKIASMFLIGIVLRTYKTKILHHEKIIVDSGNCLFYFCM
jgi:hypothetical protein